MPIRQGYFWVGETAEVRGSFRKSDGSPLNAEGVNLFVKRPNGVVQDIPLVVSNGLVAVDIPCNIVGTWYLRLECDNPSEGANEIRYNVVSSRVI